VDFDFFTPSPVNHQLLIDRLPFLRNARLRQKAADTATFAIESNGDPVAVSFFGRLGFGRVGKPIRFSDNGVYAAGLLDIAVQKMRVIQERAEAKDYLDIHTLLSAQITLESALGGAAALYPGFNPTISLKALTYFGDLHGLPRAVQSDLASAASRVREIAQISKESESILPELEAGERNREGHETYGQGLKDRSQEPELEI
jgi:hypothetical protein